MNTRRGFTLVNVLEVVVILGILAAIVLPQFLNKELQEELQEESQEYSRVCEYLDFDYCVKMEFSLQQPTEQEKRKTEITYLILLV